MFYGWRVVGAAFTVAVFGWGLGFYGPPIYLHAAREAQGWSLALVSAAVTVHFLFGSLVTANLARLYRRFGVPAVTKAGAVSLASGVAGWAMAYEPWQLIAATLLSGAGWTTMSAAAINAMVAPWFVRMRPAALTSAYNGASIAGIVFSPLWVATIAWLGFSWAAAAIGAVTIATVWILADRFLARTPQQMGLAPDGDAPGTANVAPSVPRVRPLPGQLLWRDLRFITLAAGMALGLFAQIGLIAHLFSLLVPALGAQFAGIAMAAATAAAITGRTLVGWLMPASADSGEIDQRRGKLHLSFKLEPGARQLRVEAPDFAGGKGLSGAIRLEQPGDDRMVIATPFTDAPKAFYYNQKVNCMPASGEVMVAGEVFRFDPASAFGVLDWGRGVWTYDNTWYWASASGVLGARRFGFNLGCGFGDTSAASENMLFLDGRAHKLGEVRFELPPGRPDSGAWRLVSGDGRLDLRFDPIVDRYDRVDLGPFHTLQHQVFGRFSGQAICDDGSLLEISDLTGFAEKVHNRW